MSSARTKFALIVAALGSGCVTSHVLNTNAWQKCVLASAERLSTSQISPYHVADEAFRLCQAEESDFVIAVGGTNHGTLSLLMAYKEELRRRAIAIVEKKRAAH